MSGLSIFPPRASTIAGEVDALYGFHLAVILVMTTLIFLCVFIFAVKYRRRSDDEIPAQIHGSWKLETFWSVVPFGVMLIMFGWGTKLYFEMFTPPRDALDVYVTGKQWMWKVQYPTGQREINELHVPVGQAVKITLASEDVLHSFFIPAFRVKHDVVPGHYETVWFQATEPGRYHLFCAEYCGTQHANMGGWVTVLSQADYAEWLTGSSRALTMVEEGAQRFQEHGCITCHALTGRCPPLSNVFGSVVKLADGRTVVADEAYIRESILNPNAKIVDGYKPDVMPVFRGQIDEESILQLIAYVKSLSINSSGPRPNQPERTKK
jgi:cytochrome c oxidase subunit II